MKPILTLLALLAAAFVAAGADKPTAPASCGGSPMTNTVTKTDAEWKKILTPEQYRVLREKGTERPFTGEYWNNHDVGVYRCAACNAELFTSETKFDSHCGWPSFFAAKAKQNIRLQPDNSHGMQRTEVLCVRCGGHLGHLFDDGPAPTGMRYCINSVSIKLEKRKKKEEEKK
jgi:peptide-methionine (R)-S-oxide reductase